MSPLRGRGAPQSEVRAPAAVEADLSTGTLHSEFDLNDPHGLLLLAAFAALPNLRNVGADFCQLAGEMDQSPSPERANPADHDGWDR